MVPVCPICEIGRYRLLIQKFYHFKGNYFDLSRCESCLLIHVDPIPSNQLIEEMYRDEYFREDWIVGCYDGSYAEIMKKRIREEFQWVMDRVEKQRGPQKGTLLEVGAAGGGFLDFARKRGWTVEGLEISSWGVRHAMERYNIGLDRGNIVDASFRRNHYDVIFLGDVFEHVPVPMQVLQKLNQSMVTGGHLVMLLPMYVSSWCFRSLLFCAPFFRIIGIPRRLRILLKLEPKDSAGNPPYHIFEYSKKTISLLLGKAGFRPLDIRGTLPVPEFLDRPSEGERFIQKGIRNLIKSAYKMIKFSTERLNFPLVRALVIASKERDV